MAAVNGAQKRASINFINQQGMQAACEPKITILSEFAGFEH